MVQPYILHLVLDSLLLPTSSIDSNAFVEAKLLLTQKTKTGSGDDILAAETATAATMLTRGRVSQGDCIDSTSKDRHGIHIAFSSSSIQWRILLYKLKSGFRLYRPHFCYDSSECRRVHLLGLQCCCQHVKKKLKIRQKYRTQTLLFCPSVR